MPQSNHVVKWLQGQRGGAAIWFALCLPVLVGFAALAVDLARINTTKVELQNAADASALGGAHSLSNPTTAVVDQPYNWTAAAATALDVARRNFVNASQIQDALVETGYWNLTNPSLGMRPSTGVPITGDVPAVRTTVTLSGTRNNGPLNLFFAPTLGIAERDIQASAIAVIAPPGEGTGMFPVVINMAMFTHYWDTSARKPKLDPATGKPYVFDIGSSYFSQVSKT
jgi:Flp pilus assembly protein TadG